MASPVTICNLALSRIGDRATVSSIDPPEGSAQANNCAIFYPLARDVALEAKRWGFNTKRASVTPILTNPQPGWLYAYAVPNLCMKVLKVIPPQFAEMWWRVKDGAYPFTRELDELSGQEVILTNVTNAVIVYQIFVEDASTFPPQFVSALAWLLASYLAGPVIKGDAGRKAAVSALGLYNQEISAASTLDANQNRVPVRAIPDSIRARGGSCWTAPDAPVSGPFGDYAYPWDATPGDITFYPDGLNG